MGHEGFIRSEPARASTVWGSGKVGTLVIAIVAALALAAPGIAKTSLTSYSSSSSRTSSLLITQNTAMIVNVSPVTPSSLVIGTVSWDDVSWSDVT